MHVAIQIISPYLQILQIEKKYGLNIWWRLGDYFMTGTAGVLGCLQEDPGKDLFIVQVIRIFRYLHSNNYTTKVIFYGGKNTPKHK
jgi:hypothetical protein